MNARAIKQAAIENGEATYFTGKPCRYGHIAPRKVINSNCVECCRDRDKKRSKTAIRRELKAKWGKTARAKYNKQKANAKRREIKWNLTFNEWYKILEPYISKDRRSKHGVVMARFLDRGPYEVGNIYLTTNLANNQDRARWKGMGLI